MSAPGVAEVIPHDPGAFTQGFEIRNNFLWESTGIYGQSSFRKTDPATGEVLKLMRLPDSVFAEGFTFLNDSLVCLLTWREHTAYLINTNTMQITDQYYLNTEGWGICNTGEYLVQSDGTSTLRFRDPDNFEIVNSLTVTLNNAPQMYLNELEYINGYIFANQWRTSRILLINPTNGSVERFINLSSVCPPSLGVLNGMAYDQNDTLYCTGKNWPITLKIIRLFSE